MADYVKNHSKTRSADWNYGGKNWKLSRSKIDLFIECQRCFYLDNALGVSRPKMPSFSLNIAVDHLLKKEFDTHRVAETPHPLMTQYKVNAIPFKHKDIDSWRENFVGIQYVHPETGLTISGAIDDIWINKKEELLVVDYKATSKEGVIDSLEVSGWGDQYARQLSVYQWLLRKKGFTVSDVGYFVYVNGKKDSEAFDGKLEFDVTLIAHKGDDSWIDETIKDIKTCLDKSEIPLPGNNCEHCGYAKKYIEAFKAKPKSNIKKSLFE